MPRRQVLLARGGFVLAAVLLAVWVGWQGPWASAGPRPDDRDHRDDSPRRNRLARETSPYLLLHADNPVDWYPWGPEAFARAKAEGKPIFLSVGYSSCFWCHVMERESFRDEATARFLNAHFICIKVDREERPDVDQVYMAAVQAFGNGGWPMSVFLTPDGRPFFGGTYFPPRDQDGMIGFPTLLEEIDDQWQHHRKEVERVADRLAEVVRRSMASPAGNGPRPPLTRALAAAGRAALAEQFDPEYGGFGFDPEHARRPKFPEPSNLVFLIDQHRRDARARRRAPGGAAPPASPAEDPLAMVLKTMDHMARGGIRDQLAGGYHRYSTTRYWIVPHFEKMLYDNAQLAAALVLLYETTEDPRWRREAEATLAFLNRSMATPEGGFASALDAESEGEEGKYYVWTRDEVKHVLGEGPGFEAFALVYGLKREPNFVGDRYVLLEPRSRREQAETLKTTPEALEVRLAPLRAKLLAVRDRRPAPLRDDKVLTGWNGLAIAAFADAYRVFRDPSYRATAEKAADFLWTTLRTDDGRLLRTFRAGKAKLPAYLEDYAYLAHGLLRLHAATGDPRRLDQARALTDRMLADFADPEGGGFFATATDHEHLLARPKEVFDSALPSANSVAIRNLIDLAARTGQGRYLDAAGKALSAFSPLLLQAPAGAPWMLIGLEEYLDARPEAEGPPPADVAGAPASPNAKAVVTAKAALDPPNAQAKPGGTLDATLTVTVAEGWHLTAHHPGVEELKPTVLQLAPGQSQTLIRVEYPEGVARTLAAGPAGQVSVYEGTVRFNARFRLADDARPGPTTLTFRLRYQACNDRACLAPATLDVPLDVTIAAP